MTRQQAVSPLRKVEQNVMLKREVKGFEKSAFTPVLLNIDKFDQEKPQRSELLLKAPKELRWESWVTVMSYNDTTKV
jgi:hypothetical protein